MIELINVTKRFNGRAAVADISFHANEGEILVLLGTSGCGKTTTLKMINRLIEPDSGQILFNGENITTQNPQELRKNMGFVMQHGGLFPHYTVYENIAVVPNLLKWDKAQTKSRIITLAEKLHLPENLLNRYPGELSGGQQQRVGIARALIANTPVLLMDEPFGALDNLTKASIHEEFKALDEIRQKTIIMVTHDVQEAFELGTRICLMDKGKIVQLGTPKELLYNPVNDFSRLFFDSYRLLLEHKVITLQDITPYLPFHSELPDNTTVWSALEHYNGIDSASYTYITEAFNQYRKNQNT